MTTPQQPQTRTFEDQIVDGGYTVGQLRAAFEKVQNAENWKLPIDARIQPASWDVTRRAIIWFTGSVPTQQLLKSGQLRVRACGYYSAIGA